MNEVRMICEHMLEGPEPPLREAGEVLRLARRAGRRRAWLSALAAGGTAAAMLVGAVMVVPWLSARAAPTGLAAVPPASKAVARAAPSHGRKMAGLLTAAVPAGYASDTETTFSDVDQVYPTASPAGGTSQILAGAVVRVYSGSREGRLFAYLVYDGRTVPDGDVCASPPNDPSGSGSGCAVRLVDGVPIGVVTVTDAVRGQVFEATRDLDGGWLIVGAQQGAGAAAYGGAGAAALPAPLLDVATVARLAGDPAMLPG